MQVIQLWLQIRNKIRWLCDQFELEKEPRKKDSSCCCRFQKHHWIQNVLDLNWAQQTQFCTLIRHPQIELRAAQNEGKILLNLLEDELQVSGEDLNSQYDSKGFDIK